MVKASLTLFGGDTLVVRCSERCHIHLMSAKAAGDSHADIFSVQDRDSAYLTVPYSGTWNVLIDSHSQSLEHSISYVPASISTPGKPGVLCEPGLARLADQMSHLDNQIVKTGVAHAKLA